MLAGSNGIDPWLKFTIEFIEYFLISNIVRKMETG